MKTMTRLLFLGFIVGFLISCADHHVMVPIDEADPVVLSAGTYEDVVGYREVEVDTVFPYPGLSILKSLPYDEIVCGEGTCVGTYTQTLPIVDRFYEITVRNEGTLPAYGLIASLQLRIEERDPFHAYSTIVSIIEEDFYITDILDPDWEVTLSYELASNEDVLSFMGISWEDWGAYSAKIKENADHYTSLAKKGAPRKVTIKKAKSK